MAKKILVVDDEQRVIDILSAFLSKEGFEVMTATDGPRALEVARQTIPDLIILDVMMPDMDGGEVMAQVLEDKKLKNVPVIFFTGAISDEEIIIHSDKSTGRMYMSKAGDIRKKIKAIKELLGA